MVLEKLTSLGMPTHLTRSRARAWGPALFWPVLWHEPRGAREGPCDPTLWAGKFDGL